MSATPAIMDGFRTAGAPVLRVIRRRFFRDSVCCLRRAVRLAGCAAVLGAMPARGAEEWFDRLDDALTFGTPRDDVLARLSGTVDLEGYEFSQPAPGLINSAGRYLFSPRLTMFLDLQAGKHVYAFAQFRSDRGFDPGRRAMRGRLDEYAVRVTPWTDARFNVQVGKFGTAVGNWVPRHGSWDNAFITAPLAYEHLTGMWDVEAATYPAELLEWSHVRPRLPPGAPAVDKHLRLPIVWGPSYTTGVAVSGQIGRVTYAVEAKDASLASRPRVWDKDTFRWRHPTWSGRIGYRPNAMWSFGLSASSGAYLQTVAAPTLPPGRRLSEYRQILFAQDIGFAWHHLQVWAEFFETRFAIPGVTDADAFSYYVEAKYKFTPRLAGAVRWNEQLFSRIPDGAGGRVRWGANVRRLDVGPIYRFSPHTQLKLQYGLQHQEGESREFGHVVAAQFTVRF